MELGGLVESQIREAISALSHFSLEAAAQVESIESRVNQMEVDIDHELITIIARRQPTARDLRLLMAFSKATANLERMGDEASMARMVRSIISGARARCKLHLRVAADLASGLLRKALDAFARLDVRPRSPSSRRTTSSTAVRRLVRKLITYMMEDPRTISASLDLLFLAKAIERIGDHSKNIAELIIYLVEGKDVRHQALEHIESALQ